MQFIDYGSIPLKTGDGKLTNWGYAQSCDDIKKYYSPFETVTKLISNRRNIELFWKSEYNEAAWKQIREELKNGRDT